MYACAKDASLPEPTWQFMQRSERRILCGNRMHPVTRLIVCDACLLFVVSSCFNVSTCFTYFTVTAWRDWIAETKQFDSFRSNVAVDMGCLYDRKVLAWRKFHELVIQQRLAEFILKPASTASAASQENLNTLKINVMLSHAIIESTNPIQNVCMQENTLANTRSYKHTYPRSRETPNMVQTEVGSRRSVWETTCSILDKLHA